MEGQVTAVVLAGGGRSAEIEEKFGVPHRALLRIEGMSLIERVVGALQQSGLTKQVIIVGNVPSIEGCRSLPDSGDFVQNVLAPVVEIDPSQFVLYATADIPFLSPQAVRDFAERSVQTGADMCYPIIPIERCMQAYPGLSRTHLRLREGSFTGGNLLWVRAGIVHRQADLLRRAFSARKSVWAMAKVLGMPIILRALLAKYLSPNWLSIAHVQKRVEELMGASAQAVITEYVEIGVDIDKAEHIHRLVEAGYRVG